MVGQRLAGATRALLKEGKSAQTPAAVVEAGTWEGQPVVEGTLQDIAERACAELLGSPSLLVVGEVVSLRQQISSFAPVGAPAARKQR